MEFARPKFRGKYEQVAYCCRTWLLHIIIGACRRIRLRSSVPNQKTFSNLVIIFHPYVYCLHWNVYFNHRLKPQSIQPFLELEFVNFDVPVVQ